MALTKQRLAREHRTLTAMVRIYCRREHGGGAALCAECRTLLDYAEGRLERCVFQEEKPTCAKCPVHCYAATQRERVKVIMRVAGLKMLWRHPVLAVRHMLDGFRPVPPLKKPKD